MIFIGPVEQTLKKTKGFGDLGLIEITIIVITKAIIIIKKRLITTDASFFLRLISLYL